VTGDIGLVSQMVRFLGEELPAHWHQYWVQMQKEAGTKASGRGKLSCLHVTYRS
jgi:hypothetical protein